MASPLKTYPDASRSRRWPWLLAAVVLLGGAAWLMSRGDPPEKPQALDKVRFPEHQNHAEYERMEKRRTLAPVVAALASAKPEQRKPERRDPMLAAMTGGPGTTAVVMEANALRNSPVGELLLDCLRKRGGNDPFSSFKQRTGVDMLTDVDRVALNGDTVLVSGNFENARLDDIFNHGESKQQYGDHAVLYTPPGGASRDFGAFAVWNNQMFVTGKTADDVRASIDRLEGRGPDTPPALTEQDSYGEIYGVLSAKDVGEMLGPDQKDLAAKIAEAASQVKLHVDATGDVAMVADLDGPDAQKVSDLGRTLGGALSLARIQAQAQNDQDLAELLDLAKVQPYGGSFRAEFALPMAVLEKKLGWCRERNDAGADAPATH